jgi:hypothetical protein
MDFNTDGRLGTLIPTDEGRLQYIYDFLPHFEIVMYLFQYFLGACNGVVWNPKFPLNPV